MKNQDEFDDISFEGMAPVEKLLSESLALLLEHPDKFHVDEDGKIHCIDPDFFNFEYDESDEYYNGIAAEDDEPYG